MPVICSVNLIMVDGHDDLNVDTDGGDCGGDGGDIFFYFGPFLVPTQITVVSCILVRFQKDQKLASSSGHRGTPILVGPDSQAACTSGIRCSLSTFTGGCHCRGGGRCGLPPRTRALRTSPRALAPWAPGSVFEADVFNPLIEFLEQGIIIRFLVIKDNLS